MQYYVYILKSELRAKTYVGYTNNLERRLKEHNEGRGLFSRKFRPWIMIYSETLRSEKEAVIREKYLKSAAGRRWIRKSFFS